MTLIPSSGLCSARVARLSFDVLGPRPRSKKKLNEPDDEQNDEHDDDGSQGMDEDGHQGQQLGEETSPESMPGPSSPFPSSADPNFQPLRHAPRKEAQRNQSEWTPTWLGPWGVRWCLP